jgi:hypothetical protein
MMMTEDDTYHFLKRTLWDFLNGKTLDDLKSESKLMICSKIVISDQLKMSLMMTDDNDGRGHILLLKVDTKISNV